MHCFFLEYWFRLSSWGVLHREIIVPILNYICSTGDLAFVKDFHSKLIEDIILQSSHLIQPFVFSTHCFSESQVLHIFSAYMDHPTHHNAYIYCTPPITRRVHHIISNSNERLTLKCASKYIDFIILQIH